MAASFVDGLFHTRAFDDVKANDALGCGSERSVMNEHFASSDANRHGV